jgi:hypothetical protein
MSCKYIALLGSNNRPMLCARICSAPGEEYCAEHKTNIEAVDQLDRELLQAIRERRNS